MNNKPITHDAGIVPFRCPDGQMRSFKVTVELDLTKVPVHLVYRATRNKKGSSELQNGLLVIRTQEVS